MAPAGGPAYHAATDRGRARPRNEDRVHAAPLDGAGAGLHLLAVADGVGGYQGGSWASERAIGLLVEAVREGPVGGDPGAALRRAFEAANEALWREGAAAAGPGASTTLTAAIAGPGRFWWANVGDSRAYLVRRGEAHRLSEDHSWVEEQVRLGQMTPEQATTSEHRNIITRSIGFERGVQVDVAGPFPLAGGDALVLCSDGLYGLVTDEEIARAAATLEPEAAARRLIELANERGGPDNVSVVLYVGPAGGGAEAAADPTLTVQMPSVGAGQGDLEAAEAGPAVAPDADVGPDESAGRGGGVRLALTGLAILLMAAALVAVGLGVVPGLPLPGAAP